MAKTSLSKFNTFLTEGELVFCPRPTTARFIDITGQRFARLTVLGYLGTLGTKNRHSHWACRCECGQIAVVSATHLRQGHILSCGCHRKAVGRANLPDKTTHGLSRSPEYETWRSMLHRCANLQEKNYGARGIQVCERWLDFENFYADMGERPSPQHSIERIDNNGNYEPDNCKWGTRIEQANNRRTNVFVELCGERDTVPNWCRRAGFGMLRDIARVRGRLKRGEPLSVILETLV